MAEIPDGHSSRDRVCRPDFLAAISVHLLDWMFRPFKAGMFHIADYPTDRIIATEMVENADRDCCPVSRR